MVVQSFTRLSAEAHLFSDIANQVIRHQFPVLNWWALVNVMTRASSTLAIITIVVVGTWLHTDGKASVGEIVSFMGFAMLLIGRLETAASFVSSLFFKLPALEEFFNILDERSSVLEKLTLACCGRRVAKCVSRASRSLIPRVGRRFSTMSASGPNLGPALHWLAIPAPANRRP